MARRDIVTLRVRSLVDHFDRFVAAYDALVPFAPEQLASHQATVRLRHEAGSVSAAVADPRFVASLRRTLIAWGLDKRGSRLAKETEFGERLRVALPEIIALEPFRIDAHDLPDATPERLWAIIGSLRVVDNKAKIVAGTKTLHHLLPDLVPPMDRAWTGMFFGLHDPEWQGVNQRRTFLRLYGAFSAIAREAGPQRYVTGEGWRTSRTKIIDNAMIGYCKTELTETKRDDGGPGGLISFRVPGYPPAKNEALSMLGEGHSHAPRVRALLGAARDALQAQATFTPVVEGPIALDLILHPSPERDPWDATNYLGGVADVLEDKSRRGTAVAHLGDLAQVWLYRDDRQIKQISYCEQPGMTAGYVITVRVL